MRYDPEFRKTGEEANLPEHLGSVRVLAQGYQKCPLSYLVFSGKGFLQVLSTGGKDRECLLVYTEGTVFMTTAVSEEMM